MNCLFKISLVIPTRDRPEDLSDLLMTILSQTYPPFEVIIIDDSCWGSASNLANSFVSKFALIGCKLNYVKGSDDGLPAARNLGAIFSKGEAVLFLDDDILLDSHTIDALVSFLKENSLALGVQPNIISSDQKTETTLTQLDVAFSKVMQLGYHGRDKLMVCKSGASVFPSILTKVINAQRLYGCCCCYRREVFNEFSFDTNLKRWGYMEDLDFSYRVYKLHPRSLFAIPNSTVVHKTSDKSRMPTRLNIYMMTTYWVYVFFKDVYEGSFMNLTTFLLALTGNLIINALRLIAKKGPKREWWAFVYFANSYLYALRNFKNIKNRNLVFFNSQLRG